MPLQHVAIIPDGNRRWARAQGLSPSEGHRRAITNDRIMSFVRKARALGIQYVSLWAFSTENWKRSREEVDTLFDVLRDALRELSSSAEEEGIRFRWFGRRDRVPDDVREQAERFERESRDNTQLNFQLLLDYGGRDEILRAVNRAIGNHEQVDEESFAQLLDTWEVPDPDLVIRTSGEQRLSGLYAWQATYAELYFAAKHFPAFTPDDLERAVEWFRKRERRFGGS